MICDKCGLYRPECGCFPEKCQERVDREKLMTYEDCEDCYWRKDAELMVALSFALGILTGVFGLIVVGYFVLVLI